MGPKDPNLVETRTSPARLDDQDVVDAPVLGRYTLLSKIGEGGMGQVYAAYDPKLDRRVALKLLHGRSAAKEKSRLEREAKALAQVSHPNVITIYEVDVIDDRVVLALEFVSGKTLKQLISAKNVEGVGLELGLELLTQAGRGLIALHGRGLVHRDFKPSNVLVGSDGRVRVADFGLVRPLLEETRDDAVGHGEGEAVLEGVTQTGVAVGTPAYMAPEQFVGGQLDARADQFSFCVTAWEVLTGRRPFAATDVEGLRAAARSGRVEAPPDGALPEAVEAALRKGLRPRPSARWDDLSALLRELDVELARIRGEQATPRRTRRWAVGGAGLVLIGLGFGGRYLNEQRKIAQCEGESRIVAEDWNDEIRSEVTRSLAETNIGKAVDHEEKLIPKLDEQADAIGRAHVDVCRRETVEEAWDENQAGRARWCLEQRRLELSTLVEGLRTPDEMLAQAAIQVADEFERVSDCLENGTVLGEEPVPEPTEIDAVRRVASRVSEAEALYDAGDYALAYEGAASAKNEANEIGWLPLVAQAALAEGNALQLQGKPDEARMAFTSAYSNAVRSSVWSTAANAAAALFWLEAGADDLSGQRVWADIAVAMRSKTKLRPTLVRALEQRMDARIAFQSEGPVASAELIESALSAVEGEIGATTLEVAEYRRELAQRLLSSGEFDRAESESTRALSVAQALYGDRHPRLWRFYLAQAASVASRGEFGRAARISDEVLERLEADGFATDPIRAQLLRLAGNCWWQHGELSNALSRLERAQSISRAGFESEDETLLMALGAVHRELGDYEKAEQHLSRGLKVARGSYGASHLQYANAANEYALLLAEVGRLGEALDYALEVLSIREAKLDGPSRDLALSLSAVGVIYDRQDQYRKAIPYLERAVEMNIKVVGARTVDTARAYGNLSNPLASLGRHDEAIDAAERALSIHREALGEENTLTAASYSSAGRAYRLAQRYEEAIAVYKTCVEIRARVLARGRRAQLFCHRGLGKTYAEIGNHAEALDETVRAWSIARHALGVEDVTTADLRGMVVDLCRKKRHRPSCTALEVGPPELEGPAEPTP